jgi:hypothetical protein
VRSEAWRSVVGEVHHHHIWRGPLAGGAWRSGSRRSALWLDSAVAIDEIQQGTLWWSLAGVTDEGKSVSSSPLD